MKRIWILICLVSSLALASVFVPITRDAFARTGAEKTYRIEAIEGKDGLYRFTAGHYHSLFLVTDTLVVVTDPLNKEAATWLKAEISRRFKKPIRYVIYSHSHPDHAYGGEVFEGPGTTFISHAMARDALLRSKAKTQLPDLVFEDEMTLHVDGHIIELRYHGQNNGYGSISMLFPKQKVLYVVDWIVIGRLPYKDFMGYDLQGVIRSTKEALELDFDTFVGGHANIGSKQDVRRYLAYMESLYGQVLEGISEGKTLEQIKKDVNLGAYSDLAMYGEWRDLNIEGTYKELVEESYIMMRPETPAAK